MLVIRDFQQGKAPHVDALALRAFEQFKDAYEDWPAFRARIAHMSSLAAVGEIIVAEAQGRIVGAVVYLGPGEPKAACFRPRWSIMRMLVVAPESRGQGVGQALADECLRRASLDGATVLALHTSKPMRVAAPLDECMGFAWASSAPAIDGVEYGVYVKELEG